MRNRDFCVSPLQSHCKKARRRRMRMSEKEKFRCKNRKPWNRCWAFKHSTLFSPRLVPKQFYKCLHAILCTLIGNLLASPLVWSEFDIADFQRMTLRFSPSLSGIWSARIQRAPDPHDWLHWGNWRLVTKFRDRVRVTGFVYSVVGVFSMLSERIGVTRSPGRGHWVEIYYYLTLNTSLFNSSILHWNVCNYYEEIFENIIYD